MRTRRYLPHALTDALRLNRNHRWVTHGLVFAVAAVITLGTGLCRLEAEPPPPLWDDTDDPSGNAGALKDKVETGGGYSAHNGNASRSVTDLEVPGGLGAYGLDFTRHWNSTDETFTFGGAYGLTAFGYGGWTHSWNWVALYDHEIWLCEPENGPCAGYQTDRHLIQITYPDGRSAKFSFSRTDGRDIQGNYSADPEGYPWPEHWGGDPAVDDHLRGMDPSGSSFWLFLADGGAVRFERSGFYFRATQVIDPHGLKTILTYDVLQNPYEIPLLRRVEQPGGRSLQLSWSYLPDQFYPFISEVQSGTGQRVVYGYNRFTKDIFDGYALTSATYVDDLDPATAQPIQASYTYIAHVSRDPESYGTIRGLGPLLVEANDPRFAGPMRRIHYIYRGGPCHEEPFPNDPCGAPFYPIASDDPQGGENIDFFHIKPFPVQMELSAETGQMVSQLFIPQNRDGRIYPEVGTRTETRGAGGSRVFYYGSKCGIEPGGYRVDQNNNPYWEPPEAAPGSYRAYQLGKATEFADDPAIAPFDFQRHQAHKPWRIFDGRKLLTQLTWLPWTGRVSEIWHRGADTFNGNLSKRSYNWTNPGASAAQDYTLLPNFYNHWLFSKIDEGGNQTVYTRDSRRRVTRIDHPGGSSETFTHNDFNQVLTHQLPSGAVQNYEYDTRGLLQREWNSVDGEIAAKVYSYLPADPDRVWRMQDGRARAAGKPFSVEMTYNNRHQITEVRYPSTGGASVPHISYEYNRSGDCTAITNELGQRSEYAYDPYGRCTSYTEPLNASDWKGTGMVASRTWNWYYDRWHEPSQSLRDASTHTSKQWRVQVEPAFNAAGDRHLSARKYDYNDRIIEEAQGMIETSGGSWQATPDTEIRSATFDANGNKATSTDPLGRLTTYEYDNRDRLFKTNETVNTLPRTTITEYDVTGNKTKVTFPDTRTQRWLLHDPFGQPRQFVDERNNVTDLAYQWGPMKKLDTVKTYRLKDSGGSETQLTDFDYDAMGRPKTTIFPDGTREISLYELGQLKTWQTRKNQIKTIAYDARGRESSHSWSDATPAVSRIWDDAGRLAVIWNIFSSIDYGYDSAGQVIFEGNDIAGSGGRTQTNYFRYPDGRVGHLYYPGGTYLRRDYTPRGQLKAAGWDDEENIWWHKLVDYTYRPDGKVDHQDYGNLTTGAFGYDGRGFTSSVQHKGTASGDVFAARTYARDNRDRITSFRKGVNPSSNPMENGRGDKFAYDDEGQLTDAWYDALNPDGNVINWSRKDHFVYDALGNRSGSSNNVASRNSGSVPISLSRRDNGLNQYSGWTPSTITYDDNFYGTAGNGVMMQEGYITASFNALNQPIAIWSPAYVGTPNFVWFGHDPLGRCVKRWVGESGDVYSNPAIYFHYDGWNLLQEGNNAWGPARIYMHGNRVDEIVASFNTWTGEYAYHHYDARGHCTLLTDRGGNVIEQYEYDAFGQPYFFSSFGQALTTGSAFGNRFLFTGREWLSDLKLYDLRNRHYQPELGRFLQPDPKQFEAGDYNLYRYCHNDPINHSDPMGLTIDYEYADPGDASATRAMIGRLEGMGGDIAATIKQLRDSTNRIVFIPIQRDVAGWDKYNLNPRTKGDDTNKTTPRNEDNSRNGKGTGSVIEFDPKNWKDSEGKPRNPIEAAGHEARHAAANDKGNRLNKKDEEKRAQKFQLEIRKKIK